MVRNSSMSSPASDECASLSRKSASMGEGVLLATVLAASDMPMFQYSMSL